jgi:hypothetical protein
MDALREFLDDLKKNRYAKGNLLGLLHILIGRRIAKSDGTLISNGLTWRELSTILKKYRWDTGDIHELGVNPEELPPRDRQRFWYTVIARTQVDSLQAAQAGDRLADVLQQHGYVIGSKPK